MCEACNRIQDQRRATAEMLAAAQRELFIYGKSQTVLLQWSSQCQAALKELSVLREEMAQHAVAHGEHDGNVGRA